MYMKRIGIYSGTFDPVHIGHASFAMAAAQACTLDRVAFLPEPKPREKQQVTPLAYRSDMLRLATQDYTQFEVIELPFEQFSVHYTLPLLRSEFRDCQLVLLVGSDVVQTFAYRWDNLPELLGTVELAIGLRDGIKQAQIQAVLDSLGVPVRATFVQTGHGHVASSHARAEGSDTLLDPRVAAYIAEHNLY